MALFLRIAAAVVALIAIANAIAFISSLLPRRAEFGPDTIFVVMSMGTLVMQTLLPLCMAALMVGLASVIDRLDKRGGGSGQDD